MGVEREDAAAAKEKVVGAKMSKRRRLVRRNRRSQCRSDTKSILSRVRHHYNYHPMHKIRIGLRQSTCSRTCFRSIVPHQDCEEHGCEAYGGERGRENASYPARRSERGGRHSGRPWARGSGTDGARGSGTNGASLPQPAQRAAVMHRFRRHSRRGHRPCSSRR